MNLLPFAFGFLFIIDIIFTVMIVCELIGMVKDRKNVKLNYKLIAVIVVMMLVPAVGNIIQLVLYTDAVGLFVLYGDIHG
jgi:hypothetical protein